MSTTADRLSLREAAEALGVPKPTLYHHLSCRGRVPHVVIDGRIYIDRALVERLIPVIEQRGLLGALTLLSA